MKKWTAADMPSQAGRVAIITGGSEGLGYEDARALARAGADVILASRDGDKGAAAVTKLRRELPEARVRFEELDLASLSSVGAFAERMNGQLTRVDLLINNAGVMTPPRRQTTADGFELQFGTNFLGHFALTARLRPLLQAADEARVVTLSSIASWRSAISFDDLQSEDAYQPMEAYAQSKLANLMFALELQRRSEIAAWGLTSIAAHPGLSRTSLFTTGAGSFSVTGLFSRFFGPILFQSAARGALPTLFAATSPDAAPGAYYGPDGPQEARGNVRLAWVPTQARNVDVAARLWDVAEELTGLTLH